MKCPYQDIGCWHIDDASHDCEATSKNNCQQEDHSEAKKIETNGEEGEQ